MRRPVQRNRVMSEINITPLTDVMMVLLVIFMVTTPLIMRATIDINLPKAHAKKDGDTKNIQVVLTKDQKLYLDGKQVRLNQLGPLLKKSFEDGQDPSVTISADEQVAYGEAVKILDVAKQAGATKLVIAAEPLPTKSLSEEMLNK